MSYPQPSSNSSVLLGQKQFRLKTEVAGAGDIYESEVGGFGFALGPDSDIANVRISHLDESGPGSVQSFTVSPDRSYVARIDARNDTNYPTPGSRKGRILISPEDIYNDNFVPGLIEQSGGTPYRVYDAAKDALEFIAPTLDVVQYFNSLPSIIPQRSDREFNFSTFQIPPDGAAGGVTYVAIPAYGRKSGLFTFTSFDSYRIRILGVRLFYGEPTVSTPVAGPTPDAIGGGSYQETLLGITDVTSDPVEYLYKASVEGQFDLFLIGIGGYSITAANTMAYAGEVITSKITLSDDLM